MIYSKRKTPQVVPIEIQKTLHQLSQKGAEYVALETSSHGLVQHRIKALNFAAAAFTNLSRDHLDYHGSMAEYAKAKLSLFTEHACKQKIINVDDETGADWVSLIPGAIGVSLIEKPTTEKYVIANKVSYFEGGVDIEYQSSWGRGSLNCASYRCF